MDKINTDKKTLKKFSMTMFVALFAIGTVLLIRHRDGHILTPKSSILVWEYIWFYLFGILFYFSGVFVPGVLKPVYIIWMRFAFILSWINTRLILLIIFYLIFTPIGLVMRLFGIDLLDRKIDKDKESYWMEREKSDFDSLRYERQF